tara:strand:+ start:5218 stop:5757 length:540 start_codon:yes stop_codon:yes gene_type:complete
MLTRLERLRKRKRKLYTKVAEADASGKAKDIKKGDRLMDRTVRKAPKLNKKIANTKARVVKRAANKATRVAKPKRKVTYSTAKEGNSRKKTVTSRGGKKTKVVNYTYSVDKGNQKTTTVTKKGKTSGNAGVSSKTRTKTQGRGKLNRLVQRKQRGRIVKKAIKSGTNKAKGVTSDSYKK